MPIDSQAVGSNQRQIIIVGDPSSASQLQSVLAPGDGQSLSGVYAAVAACVPWGKNASGLFDQLRTAAGTTGVLAVNTEGTKLTYSAAVLAFTPAATATDFIEITGSGTKTVRVTRISISGTATAAASVDVQLLKRSSATTGGSPSTPTVVPHDANDAAGTAVVNAFTANPTPGTLIGAIRAARLNLGAAGGAGSVVWDFTARNSKGIVLRTAAQSLNLNWNGAAVPAGTVLDVDIEWVEDNS